MLPIKIGEERTIRAEMPTEEFRHMRGAMNILQPNLVISQSVVLDETLRAGLGVVVTVDANISVCNLDGNPFAWVSLRHPTRNWNAASQPYLKKFVVPSIKRDNNWSSMVRQTHWLPTFCSLNAFARSRPQNSST